MMHPPLWPSIMKHLKNVILLQMYSVNDGCSFHPFNQKKTLPQLCGSLQTTKISWLVPSTNSLICPFDKAISKAKLPEKIKVLVHVASQPWEIILALVKWWPNKHRRGVGVLFDVRYLGLILNQSLILVKCLFAKRSWFALKIQLNQNGWTRNIGDKTKKLKRYGQENWDHLIKAIYWHIWLEWNLLLFVQRNLSSINFMLKHATKFYHNENH